MLDSSSHKYEHYLFFSFSSSDYKAVAISSLIMFKNSVSVLFWKKYETLYFHYYYIVISSVTVENSPIVWFLLFYLSISFC